MSPPGRQIFPGRGEEADGVVAPIVGEPLFLKEPVVDEGLHRQQLDRGHPELDQMVDHDGMGEPGEGSPRRISIPGMTHRHALDMRLVDDRIGPSRGRARLAPPGERVALARGRLDDRAFAA